MAVGFWVALLALALAVVHIYRLRRNGKKLNLPPGPPPIPVLGNLLVLMGSATKPQQKLGSLSKKYGPLMFLRLGSQPCIVATSPEVFTELFKKQDLAFASRPPTAAFRLTSVNSKDVAATPYGEDWKQARKILTVHVLTSTKVREFESYRVAEVSKLVTSLFGHHTLYGSEKPVNLRTIFKGLTFNIITQMAFSKRFYEYLDAQDLKKLQARGATRTHHVPVDFQISEISPLYAHACGILDQCSIQPEEAQEFQDLIREVLILIGSPLIGDYIPYLSFLDLLTGAKSRLLNAHKRLRFYLSRVVEERKKHLSQLGQGKLDILGELLNLPGVDGSDHLDDDTLIAMCQDAVIGGTDTAIATLEWIMAELISHPEITAKLVTEIDTVVGKERLVTEADIPNLPYLQAVVREGLRLHPAGPLLVPHCSTHQTKVMGYDIPESSTVLANTWAVQRDPAVWDNPMQFRPERFLGSPGLFELKQQRCEVLPFGIGRRSCPAWALGLITLEYPLVRLVQAFEWSLPKGLKPEELDMDEVFGMVLSRAHVLEAVPTSRLPRHLY